MFGIRVLLCNTSYTAAICKERGLVLYTVKVKNSKFKDSTWNFLLN